MKYSRQRKNRRSFLKITKIPGKKHSSFFEKISFPAVGVMSSEHLDLSGLKDVILPIKPALFPLAWGWWILGIALLFLLFILWSLVRYFYPTPHTYALRLLKELEKKKLPPAATGKELSKLLKRVALACFPRETVAHLTEKEWSHFLQSQGNGILSQEEADFIAFSTYMPPQKFIAFNEKKVYTAVHKWIDFIFKRTRTWKSNNKIS